MKSELSGSKPEKSAHPKDASDLPAICHISLLR